MKEYNSALHKNVPFRIASWLSATRSQFKYNPMFQAFKKCVSMPKLQTHHPHQQYFSKHNQLLSGGQLKTVYKIPSLQKNKTQSSEGESKQKSLRKSLSFKQFTNHGDVYDFKPRSKEKAGKNTQTKELKIELNKRKLQLKGEFSDSKIPQNKKKLVIEKSTLKKQQQNKPKQSVVFNSLKSNPKYISMAEQDFNKPQKMEQLESY